MFLIRGAALAAALLVLPLAARADDPQVLASENGILIEDGYVFAAGAAAQSGAAYMRIVNESTDDDRLVGVESDGAQLAELHSSDTQNGVTRMRSIEDGVPVPAGGSVTLTEGGLHVMLMGPKAPWAADVTIPVTLIFERAGAIDVLLPVHLTAAGAPGMAPGMKM